MTPTIMALHIVLSQLKDIPEEPICNFILTVVLEHHERDI